VAITCGPAWVIDHVDGDNGMGGSSTLAAVAGYPSITVPAAHFFGLPVGVSFFGRAWSEASLLGLAADFESRTHARREPQFLPTIAVH
jgi:amidase